MEEYSHSRQYSHHSMMQARHQKQKAMEPQIRHCFIMDADVHILVEYPDYKHPHAKGEEGEIYCSNIMTCYQNYVKCRWSGISPNYPNPFSPYAPRHKSDVL
ncbi:MAG: hypothetical protein LWY06_03680 [Firmicutes bacterium]|nr:hypothetical protein [Bacillota bacterium]